MFLVNLLFFGIALNFTSVSSREVSWRIKTKRDKFLLRLTARFTKEKFMGDDQLVVSRRRLTVVMHKFVE